jgi:predicted short-subunit dehydrogenase-like oxidoreductase (DUF2520 family)
MNIVLIGSGNVATILGKKMLHAQHTIVQVWSNNYQHAAILAEQLHCVATNDIALIDKEADVYIIAVSDSAIENICEKLSLNDKLVVHTAGSVSKSVLEKCSVNYGILYPLQSLKKLSSNEATVIPFFVDGNNEHTIATVQLLASSISNDVGIANDEQRMHLHLSAVIVNNFTNHLYLLANNYCDTNGVDFKKLQPLIEETAHRLRQAAPIEVQTGPAVRKDSATMTRHLDLLKNDKRLHFIYLKLSESIMGL